MAADERPPELDCGGETKKLTSTLRAPHALVRRFRLEVVSGPDAPAIYTSKGARAVIGKHETADLVLSDPTVSRFHCEIACSSDGGARVRDLESRNGTQVEGVQVLEAHLKDGATLSLGQTQVRFSVGEERIQIPLSERERFGRMVGQSQVIRAVFSLLERAAASDATVLLEGETGTGKELAAEAIHQESLRRDGPFIVVDCGSIPPNLLESELFGHERGAFTGAVASREGVFEAAHKGTIFLDEVGELTSDLQPKLLRVLENRSAKRLGGIKTVPVDVRVVAATNRNLRAEVNEGRFRPDLYYRLAVLTVRLPSLRERLEDLPLLVENFLSTLGGASPKASSCATDALRAEGFLAHLAAHSWPGNIRELRNYLERCLALQEQVPFGADSPSGPDPAGLLGLVSTAQPFQVARERWTRAFERRYLESILREHGGNVSAAARAAGIARIYFYRLLWRHGLR